MPADPNRSIDRNKSIETIEGKELETIIDKNNFSLLVNNSRLKNMDSDLMIKWLSTIIGLFTAVVGTSSLLYDKFVLPYTNPIKITLEADVKEVKNPGTNSRQVIVNATAKNIGQRKIMLYKPHWVIYGHMENQNLAKDNDSDEDMFYVSKRDLNELSQALSIDRLKARRVKIQYQDRRSRSKLSNLYKHFLGIGPLFIAQDLLPQAEIKAKRVITIPKEADTRYLEVAINIPITTYPSTGNDSIKWGGCLKYTDKKGELICLANTDINSEVPYGWMNFFCEAIPFKDYKLKPQSLINLYNLKAFQRKADNSNFIMNETYCSNEFPIFDAEERAKLSANVHIASYEIPLSQ